MRLQKSKPIMQINKPLLRNAEYKNGLYYLSFPFDRNLIDEMKESTFSPKWHPTIKKWTLPDMEQNINWLSSAKFSIIKPETKDSPTKPVSVDINLRTELRPYQLEGVRYAIGKNIRAIIGDEMGLGKTLQAIALTTLPQIKSVVVVCPASVKYVWEQQFRQHARKRARVLSGHCKAPVKLHDEIIIINYDILSSWEKSISNRDLLILDEFHYIKNTKAIRTKKAKKIAKTCKHIIGLSGTPITSRPMEFYNILNMLQPNVFSSKFNFGMRYCAGKANHYGWDFSGSSNEEELCKLVYDLCMIRRRKKDVLKDLPEKQYNVVPLHLADSGKKSYKQSHAMTIRRLADLEHVDKLLQLSVMEELKQKAAEIKMGPAIEWIEDFLESDEKLVIFTSHHSVIDSLKNHFKDKAVIFDGRCSPSKKQEAIQAFTKNDRIKLFLANMKSAGTGVDGLQNVCSNAAFMEYGWTPADHAQAEDRIHRMGQSGSVTIHYLVAQETIEELILQTIENKKTVIGNIIEKGKNDEVNIIDSLIKTLQNKKESQGV